MVSQRLVKVLPLQGGNSLRCPYRAGRCVVRIIPGLSPWANMRHPFRVVICNHGHNICPEGAMQYSLGL